MKTRKQLTAEFPVCDELVKLAQRHTDTSDHIETNSLHLTAQGSEGADEWGLIKMVQRCRKLWSQGNSTQLIVFI